MTDGRPATTSPDEAPDPIREAWAALRSHLESRSMELNEEIRHYPTPIARCDEQLTRLLEQRAHALTQLSLIAEAGLEKLPQSDRPSLSSVEKIIRSQASRNSIAK